jgi:hypothetical protein
VELIQTWAGVQKTDNLLALDLERIQRDLMLVPVVETASIHRVLPSTLRIRVTARMPVAEVVLPQLRPGGGLDLVSYYLDGDGWVIRFSGGDPAGLLRRLAPDPLPRLVGLDGARLHAGRQVELPVVRAALQLVTAFERSAMFGRTGLVSLDVSQPDVVEVMSQEGSRITFGLENLAWQLDAWRTVHEYALAHGKTLVRLDLSVSRNAPAVFADRGAREVTNPPARIQPIRNRHA